MPSPPPLVRTLIPPLTIALAVVTAGTLLLAAAALTPPPLTGVLASPPPGTVTAILGLDAGITAIVRAETVPLPPTPAIIGLARLTYGPGAGSPRQALPGPLLLVVESGSLAVSVDASVQVLRSDHMTTAQGGLMLRAGDSLVLPAATSAAFHNGGSEPVVALAAGVFPASVALSGLGRTGAARWSDAWSPGATVHPLVGGWVVDAPLGPVALDLRRMCLQPHESASLTGQGPSVLAVETGTLTMAAVQGLVWQQPPNGPDVQIAPASETTLLPDVGAHLQEEASVTLRNAGSGPVLVLLLSVEPAAVVTPRGEKP